MDNSLGNLICSNTELEYKENNMNCKITDIGIDIGWFTEGQDELCVHIWSYKHYDISYFALFGKPLYLILLKREKQESMSDFLERCDTYLKNGKNKILNDIIYKTKKYYGLTDEQIAIQNHKDSINKAISNIVGTKFKI